MDSVYYLLLAALMAPIGIGFVVRKALKEIHKNPENAARIQTKMFISTTIVETLPIVFIVLGFMNLQSSTAEVTLPIILIAISTVMNIISLFLTNSTLKRQSEVEMEEETKTMLQTIAMIGCALILAIPLVSFVGIIQVNMM